MFRSHRGLLAAGLAAVFTLSATAAFAQGQDDQGRGNQGGRRGQGGPGGFGGGPGGFGGGPGGFGGGPGGFGGGPGGFGGRGGGNPLDAIPMLLTVDVVQAELKLTDKQKQQIADITTKANEKRNALRDKMRANRGDRGNNRGGNNNGGNNNGGNNNGGNNGGNDRGGFNSPEMQAMFAEMNAVQKDTESALAKVLEKPQATRAAQIAWQLAGVQAFRMDVLVKKLNLDEGQVAQIDEILDGMRDAQRESFRAAFANMRGNNGENGGRTRGNNDENGGRTRGNNTAENGGRTRGNNDENDGNNGGRGNRPDFNSPEFQARMADMRTQQAALNDKVMGSIGKVLKKNQKAVYQNLVGVKFKDLDKVMQRRRGGPGGGNAPAAANATPAAATTPAATTAAPAPAARPQTLSERRRAAAAAAAAPQ